MGNGKKFTKIVALSSAFVVFSGCSHFFGVSAYTQYSGDGGVDDGSPITASELSTKGYQFPNELKPNATPTELANHAWRMFIAANQPTTATLSSGAGRAVPDSKRSFSDTGGSLPQSNPTVWESFYHRAEAFPYYSKTTPLPASPANQVPTYYFYTEKNGQKAANTVTGQNYVNLDENNQVGQNMLYYNDATDPNFPVVYMAKVNDVELGYVWGKPSATPMSSLSFPHPNVTGPQARTVSTIEVKSAWRRLSDIKDKSTHSAYHQVNATYYTGDKTNPTPVNDVFALIALHIIQKTANYQTFIFSTFEHVNSVTTKGGQITDPNIDLSYKQLVYGPGSPTTTNARGAYSENLPGQSGQPNTNTLYQLPAAGNAPMGNLFPVQRLKTISAEVNDVNNSVVALMPSSSVWKNYRLKGVQAVPSSYPANNGPVPQDYYLANIVVESSQPGLQLFAGTVQNPKQSNGFTFTNSRALPGVINPATGKQDPGPNVSPGPVDGGPVGSANWTMGGCMGCHGNAQQAGQDMSFLGFGLGGNGFEIDPVAPAGMSAAERKQHYQNLMDKRAKLFESK